MKSSLDVCLSPELLHLYEVKDKTVVVVDIFRATSCMVTALAHGAACIKPYADLEECLVAAEEGFETSGERNGQKVEGFDRGNSPFEYMGESIKGKKIAFTTTNGTQAIEKCRPAKNLMIGSFLNLHTLSLAIHKLSDPVLIVCAGWKGRVNLEDTLFAGALAEKLEDSFTPEDDAALAAMKMYEVAKGDVQGFLKNSSHVKRLARLNVVKDIGFCLTADQFNVVPVLREGLLVI